MALPAPSHEAAQGDAVISPLILSTFGIVFLAELPDKTSLAALALATRYPGRQVILGAWLAFLIQTLVACLAGSLLQLLPTLPVRIAAGVGFLVFAVLALRRKEQKDLKEEELEVSRTQRRQWPPWIASFFVVFAAEWGDLTQLATAALVAQTGEPIPVGIGAVLALWSVTVLAVTAGSQLARFFTQNLLNRVSAGLFAAVGSIVIITSLAAR